VPKEMKFATKKIAAQNISQCNYDLEKINKVLL